MSAPDQQRAASGAFYAQISDTELLRQVAEIARAARPQDPAGISQAAFDSHVQEHVSAYPFVPTARQIYARVNESGAARVSWARIVEASLGGDAALRQTLVAGHRTRPRAEMDDRLVYFALNYAARALDQRSLAPGQYEDVRAEALASATPMVAGLLPTANQIAQHAGGWDDALQVACLERRPATQPGSEPRGVAWVDAMALYLRHQGRLPLRNELLAFAADADFPIAGQRKGETAEQITEQFRERWQADGGWCPPGLPPRRVRVSYPIQAGSISELPRRDRRDWSELDDCAACVIEFWKELKGRREPTRAAYARWAIGKNAPAPRTFEQHGGFTAVKERAREIRSAR